eukprot:7391910-Prymnesium_polylepis.2
MHLLRRRPALARLDGHEAVRLEHGGELVALRLRLNAPTGEAGAEEGLVPVGLALVAHKRLIAGGTQCGPPELMKAALARATALAAPNLVTREHQPSTRPSGSACAAAPPPPWGRAHSLTRSGCGLVHHRARLEVRRVVRVAEPRPELALVELEQPVGELLVQHVLCGRRVVALLVGDANEGGGVLLAVTKAL